MRNLWATGCAECEAMRQWRRPNPRPPFSRLPRCIVLLCHPLYSACIRAHRVFPQIVFCNPRPYYSYVGLLVSFWRQVGHLQTRDVTCEGITIRQMLRDERHKSTSLDIDLEYSKYSRRAVLGITVGATCAQGGVTMPTILVDPAPAEAHVNLKCPQLHFHDIKTLSKTNMYKAILNSKFYLDRYKASIFLQVWKKILWSPQLLLTPRCHMTLSDCSLISSCTFKWSPNQISKLDRRRTRIIMRC